MAYEDTFDDINYMVKELNTELREVSKIYEWYKNKKRDEGWSFVNRSSDPQTLCALISRRPNVLLTYKRRAFHSNETKHLEALYTMMDKAERLVLQFNETCLEEFGEDPIALYKEWKENNE